MPCKDVDGFETYSESMNEPYQEESAFITEADNFIGIKKRKLTKVKRSDCGKGNNNIDKKNFRFGGENNFIAGGGVN